MKAYLYLGAKIKMNNRGQMIFRDENEDIRTIRQNTLTYKQLKYNLSYYLLVDIYSPIIIWTMDIFSSPWSKFFVKYHQHCHSNMTLMGSKYYQSVTFSHSNRIIQMSHIYLIFGHMGLICFG